MCLITKRTIHSTRVALRSAIKFRPRKERDTAAPLYGKVNPFASIREANKVNLKPRNIKRINKTPQWSPLDPESQKWDFDLIERQTESRSHFRQVEPNVKWINETLDSRSTGIAHISTIKEELEGKYGHLRVSFSLHDLFDKPLDLGDIVELSDTLEASNLAVIVARPEKVEDPRYTLINYYGQIVFASKHKMQTRIPRVFPAGWVENVISLEKLPAGIDPIGKPRAQLEDTYLAQHQESYFENNAAVGSTQLQTFIIPSIPGKIIADELTRFVSQSWGHVPEANLKLELLHNILQSAEFPVQLSLFQLIDAIGILDIDKALKDIESISPKDELSRVALYGKLSDKICSAISTADNYDGITLGRILKGSNDFSKKYGVSFYYSVILALRKNSKLFSHTNCIHAPSLTPLEITVNPLQSIVSLDGVIESFKQDPELFELLVLYIEKLLKKKANRFDQPDEYPQVITLMKQYCANETLDATTESFVIKILRNLSLYNSAFISKTTVYELLVLLAEVRPDENPNVWAREFLIPETDQSLKTDYECLLYNQYKFKANDDPLKTIRQPCSDTILCIDDVSAKEVDDGISVKEMGHCIEVSTFIADPASYFDSNSVLARIAFERSSTIYFPDSENSVPLLPTTLSNEIMLGRAKTPTRAMRFRFSVTESHVKLIDISPCLVDDFVKMTYEQVDESLSKPDHPLKATLSSLNKVGKMLESHRIANGAVVFSPMGERVGRIAKSFHDEKLQLDLVFDNEKPSQAKRIVSEIMIKTNALVGDFLKEKRIPALYKNLSSLPVGHVARKQLLDINEKRKKGQPINERDNLHVLSFMNSSMYSSASNGHEYLGVANYSTVTSPLRRFADLVSHWQLHSYLLGKPSEFSENDLKHQLSHLNSREFRIKQFQKRTVNFYLFKYLVDKQQEVFECVCLSIPNSEGVLFVRLKDFPVRGKLKIDLNTDNSKEGDYLIPEIGDTVVGTLHDIDLIEGDLLLESVS